MMQDPQQTTQKLMALARRAPKWAWGLAALACIVLIALLVNPDSETPPAAAQPSMFADPTASTAGLAIEVFLKFGVVLAFIYLGFYLLRRWQGKRPGGPLRQVKILETVYLTPRRSVHLLQAGGRTILIGATDQQISLLAEIEPDDFDTLGAAPATDQGPDFARLLEMSAKA